MEKATLLSQRGLYLCRQRPSHTLSSALYDLQGRAQLGELSATAEVE